MLLTVVGMPILTKVHMHLQQTARTYMLAWGQPPVMVKSGAGMARLGPKSVVTVQIVAGQVVMNMRTHSSFITESSMLV